MAVTRGIDRRAVLLGAAVAAVLAIAAGIPQKAISSSSSLTYLLLLVILGGMGVGGYVAARPQPELGMTAGGVAALLGATVAQVLNLLYAVTIGGKAVTLGNVVFIVFIVLVSGSFGVLGGYAAFRLANRDGSGDGSDDDSNDDGDSNDGDRDDGDGRTRPTAHANGGDLEP